MFSKIVEKIVKKILGDYIQQFNSENLNIGIWQGNFTIKNVRLAKNIINILNLPLTIKYSKLGCLTMNIPWSSLGSSQIQITISGLEILVNEIPQQMWEIKNYKVIETRKKLIQKYCDAIINDFAKKSTQQCNKNQQSYFGTMVMRIIDNIQVVIKDIHIRFQDQIMRMFSFGVTLQELTIYAVNKFGQQEFIDRTKKIGENQPLRKKLIMSNLGVYWNQSSEFFSGFDPHNEMTNSIEKKDRVNSKKMNYLIMMTCNAMLHQQLHSKLSKDPQIDLLIQFNELKIQISNNQLQQIVTLIERFQLFTSSLKILKKTILTKSQLSANREQFFSIFPRYFQSKCSHEDLKTMDGILQLMEPQLLQQGIKEYLQGKQKQKMIQQKIKKKKKWFKNSEQITEEQIKQIDRFLEVNFGNGIELETRNENFYYMRVNFNINALEIIISINNINEQIKQGIRTKLNQIKIQLNFREQGYLLKFLMHNLSIDLFKSSFFNLTQQQVINIVQVITPQQQFGVVKQYVQLQVTGNPLHKKYLDTQVILTTEELVVEFHPRIGKIVKGFTSVKLNLENQEAALDVYGQLKNKASEVANESIKRPFQKKNFISLDVSISAINFILLLDPEKPDSDIWAMTIGRTKISSDPQVLKKTQFTYDEPMQKYGLYFSRISFMHFMNKKTFFHSKDNHIAIDNRQKIVGDLGIDFQIQLLEGSTQQIPKIRGKTILHNIDIFLSTFTYEAIQKIGNCFNIKKSDIEENEQKQKQKQLKFEVLKQAKKLGVIYEQSNGVKKYYAALNGHYLYLYNDKKDLRYSQYYYLKNCKVTKNSETVPYKKMYQVIISNSVNTLKLGFDKVETMDEWIQAIKSSDVSEQEYKLIIQQKKKQLKMSKKQCSTKPDKLNLQICASVESVCINTLLEGNKQIILRLKQLYSQIKIHQEKNGVDISLNSVQIYDNIYQYQCKDLNNLLYSSAIAGKQKLIQINIINYLPSHPSYNFVDALVSAQFGKIICNYKPKTMQQIINFYLPKDNELIRRIKDKGSDLTRQQKIQWQKQKKKRKAKLIQKQIQNNLPECFLIQIQLKIQQISCSFINRKNKVMFSKLGLTGFDFKFGVSSRRIVMKGALKELWFGDYSNYPYTIYRQQKQYDKVYYLVQSYGNVRHMLQCDVQLLEIPNSEGKIILVNTSLSDIKASYIQQPVLRCITYLLTQIYPSLTPPEDLSKPKQLLKPDIKPQFQQICFTVHMENILVFVEPRCHEDEYIQLQVEQILIKNSSHQRQYIKNRREDEQRVVVQNYQIKIEGIKVMEKFKDKLVKLTNDLNVFVSCDLVQNSAYYVNVFGNRFEPGIRIQCQLTPFLMCINHDDYNFIMKCLFWNIIYDDNAEGYFLNDGQQGKSSLLTSDILPPPSQPVHLNLSMSKIILCVTENSFPLSVLLLNQMKCQVIYNQQGLRVLFKIKHLYGTTIQQTSDPNVSVERGMFNSFGYQKIHDTGSLYLMENYVSAFQRNQLVYKNTNDYEITFKMITKNISGESAIQLSIKNIGIAIQLKTLLILSKLALIEDTIKPPKSQIKPLYQHPQVQSPKTVVNIKIMNFVGCLSDKNLMNYIVMEGSLIISVKINLSCSEEDILLEMKKKNNKIKFRDHSKYQVQIKNYSMYFCNVNNLKNKRFILLPITNIYFVLSKYYCKIYDLPFLQHQLDGLIGRLIIQCSVKDILMINKIIQDNLQTLSETKKSQPAPSNNQNFPKQLQKPKDQHLSFQKRKRSKFKGSTKLQPIQLKIINDCGCNFMPVLNFVIQQSTLMYSGNPLQLKLGYELAFKLDFFNPRSASWEPIIETFHVAMNFLGQNVQFEPKYKLIVQNSSIQQQQQLKFNISTQLITTLLATIQIAKQQKSQITTKKQQEKAEISPYIIVNNSNHMIRIHRKINDKVCDIDVNPMFKGQLKMADKGEMLNFTYKGKKYEVSMEKFGDCVMPGVEQIHLQFRIDKLNRIISFVNEFIIKNATNKTIYCVRYNEKKQKLEDFREITPQNVLPVKQSWFVQLSFNKVTFTPPTKICSLRKKSDLVAETEKFKLSINQKLTVLNHSIIYLRAPFLIYNCLPKPIKFQFISNNNKQISTKQIQSQSIHQVFANQILKNLKFKISIQGFIWSQQFAIDLLKFNKQQFLCVQDWEDGSIMLKYIFLRDQEKYQIKLSIYCQAFILSELQENIKIYGNREKDQRNRRRQQYYLLEGQSLSNKSKQKERNGTVIDKVTLVGENVGSKLRICGSNCIIDFSEPFSTNSIGVHQARVVVQREIHGKIMKVFTILALEIQLKKMVKGSNIFSKQITIRYRQIISNSTPYDLHIREQGSQNFYFQIKKGERKPFYFSGPVLGLQQRRMLVRSNQSYESVPIASNTLGVTYFRLKIKSQEEQQFIYFKLTTQQLKSYLFYSLHSLHYHELPYQLVIKSPKFNVQIPELSNQELTKQSQQFFFINEFPDKIFNLLLNITLIQTNQSEQIIVEADDVNFHKKIKFGKQLCLVKVLFSDNKKLIVVDKATFVSEEANEYDLHSIQVKLQKVSISFIQNHQQIQKPYQAFYFYMNNLEVVMLKTNLFTRYQTRLQFLQFDQNQPFNIPDPVIITPSKSKHFLSNTKEDDRPKPIFNVLLQINNSFVKSLFFNLVAIQINDLVIRASTYFIKLVMGIVKECQDIFKTEKQFLIQRLTNTWKDIKIPKEGRKTIIKCLQIAPFTIQISAELRLNQIDKESVIFFGTIINALGVVVTNIQNAPIILDGIVLNNCIDTIEGIYQKLMEHYKNSMIRQLYKMFGSLNIIGNPVSLFRNISTGIKDMKDKPSYGFLKGPLQFGLGIAGGTTSLITHSIGGVLNTVEKVTGTFASGLAVLAFDKQFEQARQKEKMKKPKHVLEGLEKGGVAIFHGFKEGLTGIFTKPIQQAKKQGAIGLLKGTAQGMAGLILKPITGVVDFASKTTQGLKNTALYLEDKPNDTRIRYPRVFYTECSVIREYNKVDSKLYSIISKTKYEDRYGFENQVFMRSFVVNQQRYLLVLRQHLLMIKLTREKIQWVIPLSNLLVHIQSDNKIKVKTSNQSDWYLKRVNEIILFINKQDSQVFVKLIDQLKVNLLNKVQSKDGEQYQ